jgi:hypothetical protein
MIRYVNHINGFPTEVYQTTDREEFDSLKAWCRRHIGRSNGPGSSWWVQRIKHSAFIAPTYYLYMHPGSHTFLARMIWE